MATVFASISISFPKLYICLLLFITEDLSVDVLLGVTFVELVWREDQECRSVLRNQRESKKANQPQA